MPNQQRISDVLQGNQITDLRKQKLAHLSSGEKQKIAMSAVQVHDPDSYVLDEPSANLDDASCLILARALNALKQQGKTILIADHRIYYLLDIVDRIIYMDNGAIANQWIQREFKQLDPDYLSLIGIRSSAAITLKDVVAASSQPENSGNKRSESDVLQLHHLAVGHGLRKEPLLQGINLSIKKGEVVVLTGKNGIGKTMFAQTLCGLQKEKSGNITFNDQVLSKKKRVQKFWFVLQDADYQLFSDSVMHELLLGLDNTQANRALAAKLLQELGLEQVKDQHPVFLSGGQKQRVNFAVGLMRQPEYLILDEPTFGLDARNMKRMQKLIKEYSDRGIRFIIISHDFEFALRLGCPTIHMDAYRVKKT